MDVYEYKVVPAPTKARKFKDVRPGIQFSLTVEAVMNELGAEGWEYLRADALPVEEHVGLASKTTGIQNLLVFRRRVRPALRAVPDPAKPAPANAPEPPRRGRPINAALAARAAQVLSEQAPEN